jgi:hypothetical protein
MSKPRVQRSQFMGVDSLARRQIRIDASLNKRQYRRAAQVELSILMSERLRYDQMMAGDRSGYYGSPGTNSTAFRSLPVLGGNYEGIGRLI